MYKSRPLNNKDGWSNHRATKKRRTYRTVDPKEVRSVILAAAETKRLTTELSVANRGPGINYQHNTAYNLKKPDRIGDKIHAVGTQCKVFITNPSSTARCWLRLMLVEVPSYTSTATLDKEFFEGVNPDSDEAQPFGSDPDRMRIVRDINKKKFKVFYDQSFYIGPDHVLNETNTRLIKTPFIPINRTIKFSVPNQNSFDEISPSHVWCSFVENESNDPLLQLSSEKIFKYWYKEY